MDYYSPQFVVPCYFIAGILYWLLARGFINAVTWQMTGKPMHLWQGVIVVMMWPVSVVFLGYAVVYGLVKNRKMLKHSILGYWPILAHSANLTDHWRHSREELIKTLDHLKLAGLDVRARMAITDMDLHIDEIAECLSRQYGMEVGGNVERIGQVVPASEVMFPDPGCDICGGKGQHTDRGGVLWVQCQCLKPMPDNVPWDVRCKKCGGIGMVPVERDGNKDISQRMQHCSCWKEANDE